MWLASCLGMVLSVFGNSRRRLLSDRGADPAGTLFLNITYRSGVPGVCPVDGLALYLRRS
jgi:hypothetical protein